MIVVTDVTVRGPFSPVMVTEVAVEGMVIVTVVLLIVIVAVDRGIFNTVITEKFLELSGVSDSVAGTSMKVVDNAVVSVIVTVVSKRGRVTVVVVPGTVTATFVVSTSTSVT